MKRYLLELTVFLTGAVVMIFELAGSRILAPYLGTSLSVWTAIIGVILGSLSLGYFLGGKLADHQPSLRHLSFIIFLNGCLIGLAGLIKDPFLTAIFGWGRSSLELAAVLASVVLFGPASLVAGLVSPYAVKLKIENLASSGQTVGNLYALSTIGSISGTFAAGFFLIPRFGTSKIVFGLALSLLLLSLALFAKEFFKTKTAALAAAGLMLVLNPALTKPYTRADIIDIDTAYNRLWLEHGLDRATGQPTLLLQTDPSGAQSGRFLDSDEILFDYAKYYLLSEHFRPDARRFLMLGGAAYTFPTYYLNRHSEAEMTVVEIDPSMTAVAQEYFGLVPDRPGLKIEHQDARVFLNNATGTYDTIYGDAFGSYSTVPYQLTTLETVKHMNRLLDDNGLVILNLISAIEGDRGQFLRAEYATFKQVFPQVLLFAVASDDGAKTQNLILVASKSRQPLDLKSPKPEIQRLLSRRWTKPIETDLPVLTDDFAPVENYHRQAF